MCTLVVLNRPDADWPIIIGANRDEQYGRAWEPPAPHWPERPEVVAPLDELADGTWFGVNRYGLVAAVANRAGTHGPLAGKRSRGQLVLEALEHADVDTAIKALADLEPAAYRGFTLLVAGPDGAYWVAHREDSRGMAVDAVPEGLHMLTNGELDDPADARIALNRPRFEAAQAPDPETGDFAGWEALLGDPEPRDERPETALTLALDGFGTVCSHLAAVPRYPGYGAGPVFRFAPGPPDRTPFETVDIPTG
ncbi:MAG: NRDE family protein [Thiohalorhabdaceae bacterium]